MIAAAAASQRPRNGLQQVQHLADLWDAHKLCVTKLQAIIAPPTLPPPATPMIEFGGAVAIMDAMATWILNGMKVQAAQETQDFMRQLVLALPWALASADDAFILLDLDVKKNLVDVATGPVLSHHPVITVLRIVNAAELPPALSESEDAAAHKAAPPHHLLTTLAGLAALHDATRALSGLLAQAADVPAKVQTGTLPSHFCRQLLIAQGVVHSCVEYTRCWSTDITDDTPDFDGLHANHVAEFVPSVERYIALINDLRTRTRTHLEVQVDKDVASAQGRSPTNRSRSPSGGRSPSKAFQNKAWNM